MSVGGWILGLAFAVLSAYAQPTITNTTIGTAFRYQGAIRGVFPNTSYPTGPQNGTLPFEFSLWNDPTDTNAAAQIGTNLFQTLNISNGFFSTLLDFGDVFKGQRAFLAVSVFAPSNIFPASSNWINVGPRSEIGAVPYAMWAGAAGTRILSAASYGGYGAHALAITHQSVAETNYSTFEEVSKRHRIEEVRVNVGRKDSYLFGGTACLSCFTIVTLEVVSLTSTVDTSVSHKYSVRVGDTIIRTLASTNLALNTTPLGQWLPLPITNTNRFLEHGEMLQLRYRTGIIDNNGGYGSMMIKGEATVREIP